MNKDELKQFREGIGLTQGELSKALGVANNTVSRWELGTRSIPEFLPLALETIKRRNSKGLRQIKVPISSKLFLLKDFLVKVGIVESEVKALEMLKYGLVDVSRTMTADKKTMVGISDETDIVILEVEGVTYHVIAE